MTDSGSFDSGDLLYGADVQNLYDRIVSTCATAGVAGPSLSRAAFAQGTVLTLAMVNDLLGAYQRCWDASANKPGTRVALASAGATWHHTWFQDPWTQLGQMTFNPWSNWNEASEAGVTSSSNFICFAENASAGGAESGQGGGATNVTFNDAYGTIPGASGSPPCRVFTYGSNHKLHDTSYAMFGQVLGGLSVWSVIMKWANTVDPAPSLIKQYMGGPNFNLYVEYNTYRAYINSVLFPVATALPTSGIVYLAAWCDGTYTRTGWTTTRPTKWSDFASANRASGSALTLSSGSYLTAIGGASGGGGFVSGSLYYVLMSKSCLIDNNA